MKEFGLKRKKIEGGGGMSMDAKGESCSSSSLSSVPVRQNEEDIISSLPDSILCHILSFLPVRDSVATSVLSNRWKPLWILVPVLDLDHYNLSKKRRGQTFSFVDTVVRIWTLRNAISIPTPLRKLRISWCDDCLPLFVDSLVRATIPKGALQQLDLNIYSSKQPLELPRSVFFCKTLVVLKLKGTLLLNPPSASTFPTLEILLLDSVRYANCDSLSTLLASSPVLQEFTLKLSPFRMDNLDKNAAAAGKLNIIVLVPTLKFLLLHVECGSYKLHLNTPALKYFHFKGVLDEDVVLEKLPNLVKSVLEVETRYDTSDDDYAMRIWDFMGPLYNVISMELYINTAESLCHASNHDDDVPMFHNLSSLKIYATNTYL
nr:f-box/lrr-repeat protein [Quercus suber]